MKKKKQSKKAYNSVFWKMILLQNKDKKTPKRKRVCHIELNKHKR